MTPATLNLITSSLELLSKYEELFAEHAALRRGIEDLKYKVSMYHRSEVHEDHKWTGTGTTWGDTDRNAGDVAFGSAQAYNDVLDHLEKLK